MVEQNVLEEQRTVIKNLGRISFEDALVIQKNCVQELVEGGAQSLIFCEHPPVLTLGRMTKPDSLLYSKEQIAQKGVELHSVDRGGDVTLHAPGQLIVYPILDLTRYGQDLHLYLNRLEQTVIDLLGQFGIVADRSPGQTGVWVGKKKIASIGIGVKKWVSFHGIGINVNTDLKYFSLIKPCGLDVEMTSMKELLKKEVDMQDVRAVFIRVFNSTFHTQILGDGHAGN